MSSVLEWVASCPPNEIISTVAPGALFDDGFLMMPISFAPPNESYRRWRLVLFFDDGI